MATIGLTREQRLTRQWKPRVHRLREFVLGPDILRLPSKGADPGMKAAYYIQWLALEAGRPRQPEEAARILLSIATGAVRSLTQAATEQPELFRKLARTRAVWPVLWGKLPVTRWEMQTRIEALEVGADIEDAPTYRLPFYRNKTAYIAMQAAIYMVEVRNGDQVHPSKRWTRDVLALDPFTKATASDWWRQASKEIGKSFKRLHLWLLPSNMAERTLGEAVRRVGYSFRELWRLGTKTSSVEDQLLEAQKFWPHSSRHSRRELKDVYDEIEREYKAMKGRTWRYPPPPKAPPAKVPPSQAPHQS